MRSAISGLVAGLLAMAALFFAGAASAADPFEWHELAPDIFVFRMNNRNTPVIFSAEGVLVMDTHNTTFAPILKREIAKKTDQPVKYVVYSHANTDHVRGANVFADTAKFIAQKRQVARLEYVKEDSFPLPDLLFDKEMTLKLGRHEIILRDFGINHATGVTVMHIPAAKIITLIDIVYVHRLAYYFMPDFNPRAWLASLREIQKLDFDQAVVGHGSVTATPQEVADFADYLDDLLTQVQAIWKRVHHKGPHVAVEIAFRETDLTKYKDWGFYDKFRDLNILAAYHSIDMGY